MKNSSTYEKTTRFIAALALFIALIGNIGLAIGIAHTRKVNFSLLRKECQDINNLKAITRVQLEAAVQRARLSLPDGKERSFQIREIDAGIAKLALSHC